MPPIPLIDLRAQYEAIRPEIDQAIQNVLNRGQFILGQEVEALEREIAAYCGVRHAVGVASGTDALELSLRACGIGRGDEVITTAYSFFATAEAIVAVGAIPVFVDIEPNAYTLNPQALSAALTSRTKAIIPVHLYGHPCLMDQILGVAKTHRLKVIEDCAQAIGAQCQGRPIGSFGDAAALSFFPSKNLGGYGDGGMVVTDDQAVAEHIRLLRVHGSREKYSHVILGKNSRLDELQAAVLRVKLRHLSAWNDARRQHAATYTGLFKRQALNAVVTPQELPGARHVYHLYSIRTPDRDRVKQALTAQGIATQVAYPSTLPAQPALTPYLQQGRQYPVAEELSRTILSLPLYPELDPRDIERIVSEIVRILS